MEITKIFTFDAAHKLWDKDCDEHINQIKFGPCSRLHGHQFQLYVTLAGEINPSLGWLMNFSDLKNIVNLEVISKLDHFYLNDILPGLPTCELLIQWIAKQLQNSLLQCHTSVYLKRLRLYETPTSYAEIEFDKDGNEVC